MAADNYQLGDDHGTHSDQANSLTEGFLDAATAAQLTPRQWRERLGPQAYHVLREAGTEPAFTGAYTDTETPGRYCCRACGAELFRATAKFHSGCGWPAFFEPSHSNAVIERTDTAFGMIRTEVLCANCGSHLGHVFAGEGFPTPTDRRYCINSICLRLDPAE